MVCIYTYKSVSRNETIFVRYESQPNARQTQNQVINVPHTLTQLELCNLLHTLVSEFSFLFPLTLEDVEVLLPTNTV